LEKLGHVGGDMSNTREIVAADIQNRIFTLRNVQVMLDKDLAELYQVNTKVLNQAAKRNSDRFPSHFKFQLTKTEKMELVTNCDRFENLKHSTSCPFAFTEQGVAMLSAVLRSETAVKVSIQIMNAFVAMRRFLRDNAEVFQRLDSLELKQLETDKKVEKIFNAIEDTSIMPKQGIFFDGQIFDAWRFASDLVRSATSSIVLIDNYIDDSVLQLFAKRKKGIEVKLLTRSVSSQLKTDIEKFNSQYEPIQIQEFADSHDRFLIIDDKDIYHIGASLKDIGKKWFAFSKIERGSMEMLNRMKTT
jgi:hypothetical protein